MDQFELRRELAIQKLWTAAYRKIAIEYRKYAYATRPHMRTRVSFQEHAVVIDNSAELIVQIGKRKVKDA